MTDWNATEYHRVSDPQFGWGLKVVERVAKRDLCSVGRVCDAGCGTGRVTGELIKVLPNGCSFVAVDDLPAMLDIARRALAECSRQVDFVRADFQQLPFENEFDLIFSTAAFHWASDHDRLFRSLYRALKPGGFLLSQCGGGANLSRIREREMLLRRDPRFAAFFVEWKPAWNYAGEAETTVRVKNAGFCNCEVWLEAAPVTMEDERSYRAFLETVIERTQLGYLPDEKTRQAYLDEMVLLAEGDPTFDYWRLNIDAVKPAG